MLHPYEIAGRTIAEYIIRAFWKEAPHIEAISRVNAAIWVIVFALIMLIYGPYLSFKLTYTPSTRRLLTGPFVNPYILTIAFILNFL